MNWNRCLVALALAAFSCVAAAGEIYKCKAADGSVTFTNIKCPDTDSAQHYGSYQRAPDPPPPDPYGNGDGGYADNPAQPHYDQAQQATPPAVRANTSAIAAIHSEDPRSRWGTVARNIRVHFLPGPNDSRVERAAKSSAQAEGMRLLVAAAQAGESSPPSMLSDYGYLRKVAAGVAPPPVFQRSRPADAVPAQAPPRPPVYVNECIQNGPSVRCTNSDGSISHGSIDPFGNGSASSADGTVTRIHKDPAGRLKTDSGVCVKDIYGQCQ